MFLFNTDFTRAPRTQTLYIASFQHRRKHLFPSLCTIPEILNLVYFMYFLSFGWLVFTLISRTVFPIINMQHSSWLTVGKRMSLSTHRFQDNQSGRHLELHNSISLCYNRHIYLCTYMRWRATERLELNTVINNGSFHLYDFLQSAWTWKVPPYCRTDFQPFFYPVLLHWDYIWRTNKAPLPNHYGKWDN